jgi:hypothetical protein
MLESPIIHRPESLKVTYKICLDCRKGCTRRLTSTTPLGEHCLIAFSASSVGIALQGQHRYEIDDLAYPCVKKQSTDLFDFPGVYVAVRVNFSHQY